MRKRIVFLVWILAIVLFSWLAVHTHRIGMQLGSASVVTGWSLVFLFIFLSLFNIRKRLSMIPLGNASLWLLFHAVGGFLAIPFFYLHTREVWPQGLYEQILTIFFYLITLNGIAGYLLQKVYPPRLTQTGVEIIYERIPEEIAELRNRAEATIASCTEKSGSQTLAKHYFDTLDWFFRRPRFFVSHALGGQKGSHWVRNQFDLLRRYLSRTETEYLEQLEMLAQLKDKIDFHYVAQSIMKRWLLLHVPLTVGLLTLVAWHVVLVHVYRL